MTNNDKNILTDEQLKKYNTLTNEQAIELLKSTQPSSDDSKKNTLTEEQLAKYQTSKIDVNPTDIVKAMRDKHFNQNTNDNSLKNK